MRKISIKSTLVLAATLLTFSVIVGACSSDESDDVTTVVTTKDDSQKDSIQNDNQTITELDGIFLTIPQRDQVAAVNDFSFRLAKATMKEGRSQVLSPLSVAYLVGMLSNGTSEATTAETLAAMGLKDVSLQDFNEFLSLMLSDLPRLDLSSTLLQNNAIFTNLGIALSDAFRSTAEGYYNAHLETLDFTKPSALVRINQWASESTRGMIENLLNSLPPSGAIAMNAVYFKGGWIHKFDALATVQEPFGADSVLVPMMHMMATVEYGETGRFRFINLPYGNGAFQMTVLLPNEGLTTADVADSLDNATFRLLNSGNYNVDIKLPRFETTSSAVPLMQPLTAMGMASIFSNDERFLNMCPTGLISHKMFQTARIIVDEDGSQAAAVTYSLVGASGGESHEPSPAVFHADRPFLYIISDRYTKSVLFIGNYEGD